MAALSVDFRYSMACPFGTKYSATTFLSEKCVPLIVVPSGRRRLGLKRSIAGIAPSRRYNTVVQACFYTSKQLPRRCIAIAIASAADSGQTYPSQDKDEQRGLGCANEGILPKRPSPEIEPADVVRAQLQALHNKDMETVFEFASPKNKAHTGPLSRFSEMIEGRAYNIMLGHASAEILSTLNIAPGRFQQRVLIKGSTGNQSVFSWSLTRQEEDPFKGCWMTDSVHRDE